MTSVQEGFLLKSMAHWKDQEEFSAGWKPRLNMPTVGPATTSGNTTAWNDKRAGPWAEEREPAPRGPGGAGHKEPLVITPTPRRPYWPRTPRVSGPAQKLTLQAANLGRPARRHGPPSPKIRTGPIGQETGGGTAHFGKAQARVLVSAPGPGGPRDHPGTATHMGGCWAATGPPCQRCWCCGYPGLGGLTARDRR